MEFHSFHGSQAVTKNGGRLAERKTAESTFNNAIVFSKQPLNDGGARFEVILRRKVATWSGSIRIGITPRSPERAALPNSAVALKDGSVVLSGRNVIVDGRTQAEKYSRTSLDAVDVGGRVGVEIRNHCAYFYVDGENQGKAMDNLRDGNWWAVVDLYGQCAEVEVASSSFPSLSEMSPIDLAFHLQTGRQIDLLSNGRKAKRRAPLEEFNNAVILSNRPLLDNEIFEITIEEKVSKWSGSVEVGVTTHQPEKLSFPTTMTNMRSGTWIFGGEGVIKNGTRVSDKPYTRRSIDSLKVGSRIGVVRKSGGNLHFLIDGIDQGLAVRDVPSETYAVVDLYGQTSRVALTSSTGTFLGGETTKPSSRTPTAAESSVGLINFHPRCSKLARVMNDGKAAQRLKASEEFNYGIVLTNRPLVNDEIFEVVIECVNDKWAGSIEIGVTTHAPNAIEFPSTMTNMRTGTWVISSDGIQRDGVSLSSDYGEMLDSLSVKDRVGVMRSSSGDLRFFINGRDQGLAASGLPSCVYGFVDLYGQCVQVSIAPQSRSSPERRNLSETDDVDGVETTASEILVESDFDSDSDDASDAPLQFHRLCGSNVRLHHNRCQATRTAPESEFNNAVCMTSRPLRDNERFEVVMVKMVARWSGSAEIGVTLIKPNELDFPDTMTDVDHGTWMLSGTSVMKDGNSLRRDYPMNLDEFCEGVRIGVARKTNGDLHFYWNGSDKGVAASKVPSGVYGVIDVYGQCAEVKIVEETKNLPRSRPRILDSNRVKSYEGLHRFHAYHGRLVTLSENDRVARRTSSFNNGIVLSSEKLQPDEIFEICIVRMATRWSGSLEIGLTTQTPDHLHRSSFPDTCTALSRGTWAISGSTVLLNGMTHRDGYGISLDTLKENDRVGVARHADGTMHVYVNGIDQGVAAKDIPRSVYAVVDLYGQTEQIEITSKKRECVDVTTEEIAVEKEVSSLVPASLSSLSLRSGFRFSDATHGKNIQLHNNNRTATRISSYNQGIVFSESPLPDDETFQIRLSKLNRKWSGSLGIGITSLSPTFLKNSLPQTATGLKSQSIIISSSGVFRDGNKIKERYCSSLEGLTCDSVVGIACLSGDELHLYIDGVDQGVAAYDVPSRRYAVVDVYGIIEAVTIELSERRRFSGAARQRMLASSSVSSIVSLEKSFAGTMEGSSCEYMALARRFFSTLAIPEVFMNTKFDLCYCRQCHEERNERDYYNRGKPPLLYAIPVGWFRFGLKLPAAAEANNVHDTHHRAYHGTSAEAIRPILDTGSLLLPGDVALGGHKISEGVGHYNDGWKPKGFDTKKIFLSPTIKYAGLDTYARRKEYIDSKTGKKYWARVAFQVWIRPGSYVKGKSTMAVKNVDSRISDTEIEWSTVERGATHLPGILVKLEPR